MNQSAGNSPPGQNESAADKAMKALTRLFSAQKVATNAHSRRRHRHPRPVIVLPMSGLFQGVSDLLRHVSLVVLGQDGVGGEKAGAGQCAFGDNAQSASKIS